MGRVLQRLAVAVGSGVLLVVLVQCNALKQKPGDKCVNNGAVKCTDGSNALLCQGGTISAITCRGPKGCSGAGASGECDDDLAQAGEGCIMGSGGQNYSCGTDLKSELVCTAGKWTVNSTCKGPGGCKVTGTMVHCDDDFADINDPCQSSPSEANYSCTPDKKTEVVCTNNKFVESEGCHGQKGCYIENNSVYCDTSMAKEGDKCRHADNHACSDDATAMLKCSPQMTWVKQTACKSGCKVKGREIDCN
jgi:hypothetical protein